MKIHYPSISRFQQFVELNKDFRPPTKKEHVRYVRKLAEHFQCDPLTLSENQLREYFLFLRQHKQYKRSPMNVAKCALRCFYLECHKVSGWTVFGEIGVSQPFVLPVVLGRQEVAAVLGAVREPRFSACLRLIHIYHCGLRVGEATRIEVRDLQDITRDAAIDQALLARGFHIVIPPLTAQSGAVKTQWNNAYELMTSHGFSKTPVMEGTGTCRHARTRQNQKPNSLVDNIPTGLYCLDVK